MDTSTYKDSLNLPEKVLFPVTIQIAVETNYEYEKTDASSPKDDNKSTKKVLFQESVDIIKVANARPPQECHQKAKETPPTDTSKGKGPERKRYSEYESFPAYPGSPQNADSPVRMPSPPRRPPSEPSEHAPSPSPPPPSNPPSRPRSLSGRVTSGLVSLFRSRSHSTPEPDPSWQPPRTGTSPYCKHAWDDPCRCMNLLRPGIDGDYCPDCWYGRCPLPRTCQYY
ncbi:Fc.00g064300.m01.CDS01 [Cosmosporella sp. VM-42]